MKEREQAARAAHSYMHNRDLKPKVEERLAKAVARLESYLLLHDTESVCLGRYKVERVEGQIVVSELPPEGWEQLTMSGFARDSREPSTPEERLPPEVAPLPQEGV